MYKTIDLFAGIGGIRRGFELTGIFKNVLSAEIDKFACETYQHLFGENPFNNVASEEFKNKVSNTNYDVLLAGFPCQAFSRAGKKEGFLDQTRGTLFFEIADIIKRTKPKAFLLENVDNLLSHDKGNTFRVIIEILVNELNYKVIGVEKGLGDHVFYENKNFMRNSRFFGVPQNRPRIYIMGFNKEYYGSKIENLPQQSLPSKREGPPIYKNLHELIEYKAPPEYYIAQGYLNTLKKHKEKHQNKGNGFGYIVVNAPEIENPYSNAVLATGGSGKERNLIYDPQNDIVGLKIKGKKTPLNNEFIRHMTPREWGKLQGFIGYAFLDKNKKDLFEFPPKMSKAQMYKQFGNSVTIPVIEQMAIYMGKCLDFLEKSKG